MNVQAGLQNVLQLFVTNAACWRCPPSTPSSDSGLTSQDPDTLYDLVRYTGFRFFSLALPGYSAFLFDYLAAANTIISSSELNGVPRTEAVSVAVSLLA